jgi:hypothetical protein
MYIGIGTLVVIVIIVLIILFLRRLPIRRRMHKLYNPAFARDRDSPYSAIAAAGPGRILLRNPQTRLRPGCYREGHMSSGGHVTAEG